MSSEIKPIVTDDDHEAALKEIKRLWDVKEASPEADRLEALAILVEAYEKKRYPIGEPTPEEALRFRREQAGLPPDK